MEYQRRGLRLREICTHVSKTLPLLTRKHKRPQSLKRCPCHEIQLSKIQSAAPVTTSAVTCQRCACKESAALPRQHSAQHPFNLETSNSATAMKCCACRGICNHMSKKLPLPRKQGASASVCDHIQSLERPPLTRTAALAYPKCCAYEICSRMSKMVPLPRKQKP